MIRAVLFDLDGVLVDAAHTHFQALNLALVECGYKGLGVEEHKKRFDGLPTITKLKMLVADGTVNTRDVDRIKRAKQTNTMVLFRATVKFDPTVYCVVAGIEASGLKWGIVTNAVEETARFAIERLKLPYPDCLVTNTEADPKPSPAMYQLAARRLGVQPPECLVFEDGDFGVESATRANCHVVRVHTANQLTPKFVFDSIDSLR